MLFAQVDGTLVFIIGFCIFAGIVNKMIGKAASTVSKNVGRGVAEGFFKNLMK